MASTCFVLSDIVIHVRNRWGKKSDCESRAPKGEGKKQWQWWGREVTERANGEGAKGFGSGKSSKKIRARDCVFVLMVMEKREILVNL